MGSYLSCCTETTPKKPRSYLLEIEDVWRSSQRGHESDEPESFAQGVIASHSDEDHYFEPDPAHTWTSAHLDAHLPTISFKSM